jgi:hypothetical protein
MATTGVGITSVKNNLNTANSSNFFNYKKALAKLKSINLINSNENALSSDSFELTQDICKVLYGSKGVLHDLATAFCTRSSGRFKIMARHLMERYKLLKVDAGLKLLKEQDNHENQHLINSKLERLEKDINADEGLIMAYFAKTDVLKKNITDEKLEKHEECSTNFMNRVHSLSPTGSRLDRLTKIISSISDTVKQQKDNNSFKSKTKDSMKKKTEILEAALKEIKTLISDNQKQIKALDANKEKLTEFIKINKKMGNAYLEGKGNNTSTLNGLDRAKSITAQILTKLKVPEKAESNDQTNSK